MHSSDLQKVEMDNIHLMYVFLIWCRFWIVHFTLKHKRWENLWNVFWSIGFSGDLLCLTFVCVLPARHLMFVRLVIWKPRYLCIKRAHQRQSAIADAFLNKWKKKLQTLCELTIEMSKSVRASAVGENWFSIVKNVSTTRQKHNNYTHWIECSSNPIECT